VLITANEREDDQEEVPTRLDVYGGEQDLETRRNWLELVRGQITSLEVRKLPDGPLPQMAAWIVAAPGINLMQGDFARRSDVVELFWRPWRVAVGLLVGLAVVMLVSQGARLWQLNRLDAQLDSAIEEVFLAAFPGVKAVSDPRSQLRQQLALARGGDVSSSDFLPMLVALGQVLKVSNNTRIEGLSVRNNTLDVQLSAPDVAVLDKIQKQVADTGFQVQIQAANPKDDRVEGRLEIKGSGA
jgi:type II secretion system protein L